MVPWQPVGAIGQRRALSLISYFPVQGNEPDLYKDLHWGIYVTRLLVGV